MSPKKIASDAAPFARLHGKSSMSEVLLIERQRLMEQAAEEMRAQLAPPAVAPQPAPFEPKHVDTYQPSKLPERPAQEGVSRYSRFVGEDLSEFVGIVMHTAETATAAKDWPVDSYYLELGNTLPFSSERQLLHTICRLTVGCESFSCRITLDALSASSGIRNGKTLRKWLADLQKRRYLRYIPVHGDLRGSVIEITPPDEIRASIERNWRNSRRKV